MNENVYSRSAFVLEVPEYRHIWMLMGWSIRHPDLGSFYGQRELIPALEIEDYITYVSSIYSKARASLQLAQLVPDKLP